MAPSIGHLFLVFLFYFHLDVNEFNIESVPSRKLNLNVDDLPIKQNAKQGLRSSWNRGLSSLDKSDEKLGLT